MTERATIVPRRVLMTADAVGGVWTVTLELARALSTRGIETVLAVMGPAPRPEQIEEARAIPHVEIACSSFRLEWQERPWDDVAAAGDWLLELERDVDPDVIHLNGFCHGALAWRAPVIVVGHTSVTSWFRAVRSTDAPRTWDRYRAEVARGLAAADLVVAPSRAMLDALSAHHGPIVRARVIPNGLDPRPFFRVEKERFVLSTGRLWDEAKNVAALAEAATRIPWPVVVAGDDRAPDGTRKSLPNVRALGWLDRMGLARQLALAPVFALPARYEPFGIGPLEAALSGAALVLGDIPSLREVWRDAALYVPPDDREALARTVARVCRDALLRGIMSARALARGLTFGPDRMAVGYLAAYSDVIEARRAAEEVGRCA